MAIQKRNLPSNSVQDPGAIDVLEYNNAAGARKIAEVGRHLVPLATPGSGTGYTTDVSSAAFPLPSAGRNLAVYNNNTTVGAITLGNDNTITALAAGATDSSGRVGIPCAPNAWTYIACGSQNWVKSSAATLLVFLIDDDTFIQVQSQNNAST
jgi:hypothetical protein